MEIRRYSDEVNLFARWFERTKWKTPHLIAHRTREHIYIRDFGDDVRLFTDFRPLRGDVWWMSQ